MSMNEFTLDELCEAHYKLCAILEGVEGFLNCGVAAGQLVVRVKNNMDESIIPEQVDGIPVAVNCVDHGEWWL